MWSFESAVVPNKNQKWKQMHPSCMSQSQKARLPELELLALNLNYHLNLVVVDKLGKRPYTILRQPPIHHNHDASSNSDACRPFHPSPQTVIRCSNVDHGKRGTDRYGPLGLPSHHAEAIRGYPWGERTFGKYRQIGGGSANALQQVVLPPPTHTRPTSPPAPSVPIMITDEIAMAVMGTHTYTTSHFSDRPRRIMNDGTSPSILPDDDDDLQDGMRLSPSLPILHHILQPRLFTQRV